MILKHFINKVENRTIHLFIIALTLTSFSTNAFASSSVISDNHYIPLEIDSPPLSQEVFLVAEEMPRFPGAEHISDKKERMNKANSLMLEYIYSKIKYPKQAKENGTEGMAIVAFIVETDGTLSDIELRRNPGDGIGEEVLRVINTMNSNGIIWIPGKQNGREVRVEFRLPLKFDL